MTNSTISTSELEDLQAFIRAIAQLDAKQRARFYHYATELIAGTRPADDIFAEIEATRN
jgi:hypothetical protein